MQDPPNFSASQDRVRGHPKVPALRQCAFPRPSSQVSTHRILANSRPRESPFLMCSSFTAPFDHCRWCKVAGIQLVLCTIGSGQWVLRTANAVWGVAGSLRTAVGHARTASCHPGFRPTGVPTGARRRRRARGFFSRGQLHLQARSNALRPTG